MTREPLPDDYAATLQALVENCYRHLREALEESMVKDKKEPDAGRRKDIESPIKTDGAQVLYSGLLPIDYAQFYVDQLDSAEDEDYLTPDAAFKGQVNGLCGAARLGRLWLVAGPQAGVIHIDVLVHPAEPELTDGYEDVVECSVSLGSEPVGLCSWAHEEVHSLDLAPGDYRVRYSIQGMDREDPEADEDGPVPGQGHLLQFWPAPPQADEVVRQGSEQAAYWHGAMPGLV